MAAGVRRHDPTRPRHCRERRANPRVLRVHSHQSPFSFLARTLVTIGGHERKQRVILAHVEDLRRGRLPGVLICEVAKHAEAATHTTMGEPPAEDDELRRMHQITGAGGDGVVSGVFAFGVTVQRATVRRALRVPGFHSAASCNGKTRTTRTSFSCMLRTFDLITCALFSRSLYSSSHVLLPTSSSGLYFSTAGNKILWLSCAFSRTAAACEPGKTRRVVPFPESRGMIRDAENCLRITTCCNVSGGLQRVAARAEQKGVVRRQPHFLTITYGK